METNSPKQVVGTTTITVCAHELRIGDELIIDDIARTVDYVMVGRSETRVDLAGAQFPSHFILWNGDPCKVVFRLLG